MQMCVCMCAFMCMCMCVHLYEPPLCAYGACVCARKYMCILCVCVCVHCHCCCLLLMLLPLHAISVAVWLKCEPIAIMGSRVIHDGAKGHGVVMKSGRHDVLGPSWAYDWLVQTVRHRRGVEALNFQILHLRLMMTVVFRTHILEKKDEKQLIATCHQGKVGYSTYVRNLMKAFRQVD